MITNNVNSAILLRGNLIEVDSNVLEITGGTKSVFGNVSVTMKQASALTSGFLSHEDWSRFNRTYSLPNILPYSSNGLLIRTGEATVQYRSISVFGTGLSVINADGVLGNPTIVSNATSSNTLNTIVSRDASGNFSAGTITANLSGNANTATSAITANSATTATTATLALTANKLTTARTINGISFDGTENIIVYTHPTGDGNLHVPSTGTGSEGKVLVAGTTAGSISWQTLENLQVTNPNLILLSNVTASSDSLFYFTGANAASTTTLTASARSLLNCHDFQTMRYVMGFGSIATQDSGSVNIGGGQAILSSLNITGLLKFSNIKYIYTDYSILSTDMIIIASGQGSPVSILLPDANINSGMICFVKAINIENPISVISTQLIDDSSTFIFSFKNESILVVSNGTNWVLL